MPRLGLGLGSSAAVLAGLVLTIVLAGPVAAQVERIELLGDGAWSWFADPRAVTFKGAHTRTYVGWVAQDGDVKVSAYDHASKERTTAVLRSRLQDDDHANPVIQVRPDGRLVVYYSAHTGGELYYRVSSRPEDVSAWGPPQTVDTNTSGPYGYTYPNPQRLAGEGTSYLFWRGGNFQPTFSSQRDGESAWSSARTLISVPGQRPYVKYESNGQNAIQLAFTNAHPASSVKNNLYYARIEAGSVRRLDGTEIAPLGTAISPSQADLVYDGPNDAWVHDIALDSDERPVIVFATFPSTSDHRYLYARWTGNRWETHPITPAGGSIATDPREPYYSGGITLDHEDPSVVYLSRQVGDGFEVEIWKASGGGASWTPQAVTTRSTEKNVRPVSPRGLVPFGGDLSVVWMRGSYDYYIAFRTSLATLLAREGNSPPLADAEASPRGGRAPLEVRFDGTGSHDPDNEIVDWSWDFGDGRSGSGPTPTHRYREGGRYFARLTVTDAAGARDVFVTEIVVEPPSAPSAWTGAASDLRDDSATLHGAVGPQNQRSRYWFEYGPTTAYGSKTHKQELAAVDEANHQVSAPVSGLNGETEYHYRLVAKNATGTTAGSDHSFVPSSVPPRSSYREAVLADPRPAAYWRLGEPSGQTALDQNRLNHGAYAGNFLLGELGALPGDPDSSVAFDGASAEMSAGGPALSTAGSLEGWFRWQAGVGLLRDNTAANGWILAYESSGSVAYRVGGSGFRTPVAVSSLRDGWHHIVATKDGAKAALYLDGKLVHSASDAGSAPAVPPWHVMRNGTYAQYAEGAADEIALYGVALTAEQVEAHYKAGSTPVDNKPPETVIDSGPSGTSRDRSPSFAFHASEDGSSFECKLDRPRTAAGQWRACGSPRSYAKLRPGRYRFAVRASDAAGNTDPMPALRSFRIKKRRG